MANSSQYSVGQAHGRHWLVVVVLTCFTLTGVSIDGWAEDTNGLWLGVVRVDKISEPQSPTPTKPEPTGSPFEFPIILHVSDAGSVSLLKEVVILAPDEGHASGTLIVDPGALPATGKGLDKARRFATAAFDFPGTILPMQGRFAVGKSVNAKISLDSKVPTHPFAHRYHPDHDNLDESYVPLPSSVRVEEIYTIGRAIGLEVEAHQEEQVRGIYRERLTGLHKTELFVSGTFRLERITRATNIKHWSTESQ